MNILSEYYDFWSTVNIFCNLNTTVEGTICSYTGVDLKLLYVMWVKCYRQPDRQTIDGQPDKCKHWLLKKHSFV